ncbi:MAG: hypothetical protein HQM12_17080 [SAR324 cluster bacterium]|nr:hypothetical protein [SAR324 cluster bacterium]MBF0352271.1 hypothetical protein [SAR324 cluster bacterium]
MRKSLFLLLLFSLLVFSNSVVWALQARLQLMLPLAGEATAQGFGNEPLLTSELGLMVLQPVTRDIGLGLGYTWFNAYVEEEDISGIVYLKNQGSFQAHLFHFSVDYSGLELGSRSNLLLRAGLSLPFGGSGDLKAQTRTIAASGISTQSETQSTSEVSGYGLFLSCGVEVGRWEWFVYSQKSAFAYGLKVERLDGKTYDTQLDITEYGLGLGILF